MPRVGGFKHLGVEMVVVGRGNHQENAIQLGRVKFGRQPFQLLLIQQCLQFRAEFTRCDQNARARTAQQFNFSRRNISPADNQNRAARKIGKKRQIVHVNPDVLTLY
jgi:hypothetical protein